MLSPFEWWCRNFILPDICKPCLFVFLRNLFYLTPCHLDIRYVYWYITWALMEERFATWGDIEKLGPTWEELEKMVRD